MKKSFRERSARFFEARAERGGAFPQQFGGAEGAVGVFHRAAVEIRRGVQRGVEARPPRVAFPRVFRLVEGGSVLDVAFEPVDFGFGEAEDFRRRHRHLELRKRLRLEDFFEAFPRVREDVGGVVAAGCGRVFSRLGGRSREEGAERATAWPRRPAPRRAAFPRDGASRRRL